VKNPCCVVFLISKANTGKNQLKKLNPLSRAFCSRYRSFKRHTVHGAKAVVFKWNSYFLLLCCFSGQLSILKIN
jgi:hypothetical protein